MEWLTDNWVILAPYVFILIEKVIKLSPTKKDDIILDCIIKPLWDGNKPEPKEKK